MTLMASLHPPHVNSTCGPHLVSDGSLHTITFSNRLLHRVYCRRHIPRLSSYSSTSSGEIPTLSKMDQKQQEELQKETTGVAAGCVENAVGRRALCCIMGMCWVMGESAAWAGGNPAVTRGLGKYVKKKKLDKIDTYLPPLFLARDQLIRVGRVMLQSPAEARELLRSGAFSGLRENIRSVGEYVSREKGDEALGKKLVASFFSELEAVDFALLSATRSQGSGLDVEGTRTRLDGSIKALDALVGQVPEDIVEKAKGIAAAVDALDVEASTYDLEEESRLQKLI